MPSFVPSIIEVSSAPKHTGQAKTLELPPIATTAPPSATPRDRFAERALLRGGHRSVLVLRRNHES